MKFLLFIVFTGLVGESLAVDGTESYVKCQQTVCKDSYEALLQKIVAGEDSTDAQKAYDKCIYTCRLAQGIDGFPVEGKPEATEDSKELQESEEVQGSEEVQDSEELQDSEDSENGEETGYKDPYETILQEILKCHETVCKDFYEILFQKIVAGEDSTDAQKAYDKCINECRHVQETDGSPVDEKFEADFAKCHETCKDFYEILFQKIVAGEDSTDAQKGYDKCIDECRHGQKIDESPSEQLLEAKESYTMCQEMVCKDFYETLIQKIMANEDSTNAQKAYDECIYTCLFALQITAIPVEPKLEAEEGYVKCQEIVCKDFYETLLQKYAANEDATDEQRAYDKCMYECRVGQEIYGISV